MLILKEKGKKRFSTIFAHLYRAGHCAEGKHSGTVFNGRLAVKCSLSVNKQHSNLTRQDAA